MALVYVTGLSATGKSAVLDELRSRGYQAHGVDEDGYADWIHRHTGAVGDFPDNPDFDFHAWYVEHNWVLSVPRIEALSREAASLSEPVFLCGIADGEDQVRHLFGTVIALVADLQTLKQRIAIRDNLFGKHPEELALIIALHVGYEDAYRGFGAAIVDATRPLAQVTDEILAIAHSRRHVVPS